MILGFFHQCTPTLTGIQILSAPLVFFQLVGFLFTVLMESDIWFTFPALCITNGWSSPLSKWQVERGQRQGLDLGFPRNWIYTICWSLTQRWHWVLLNERMCIYRSLSDHFIYILFRYLLAYFLLCFLGLSRDHNKWDSRAPKRNNNLLSALADVTRSRFIKKQVTKVEAKKKLKRKGGKNLSQQ